MSDQGPKTMHPLMALCCGLAYLGGVAALLYGTVNLIHIIPAEDAASAYEATVWAFVGLLLSAVAGARMTGADNPFTRLTTALGSLMNMVRRR